jgi:putative transposase
MPNHIHGILHLIESELLSADFVRAGLRPASTGDGILPVRQGIPEILRALKSFSSRWINEFRGTPGVAVWQRNYYEHIIRDEEALSRIQEYILTDPLSWWCDRENPAADSTDDFDRWLETQGENPIRHGRL